MKGIIDLILAALLGTTAALIFVTNFSAGSIVIAILIALVLWSPTNYFFTRAQVHVKSVATSLIVFSVASTITDTLGGLVIQSSKVVNVFTLAAGLLAGILVIYYGARSKDFEMPNSRRELVLYALGIIGILFGFVFSSYWYVQVGLYALGDLFGAVLALRLLQYIPENSKYSGILQYAIGLVAFVPITITAVLMFRAMQTVAIVGPSATIVSCGVAMVGSKLLAGKAVSLRDVGFLGLSVVCVLLIFVSF